MVGVRHTPACLYVKTIVAGFKGILHLSLANFYISAERIGIRKR
ncbi:hypothetical protein MCP1_100011 [Candidatus Terasakiella magnetica]|nr:hypothetical protein MCP1_100011 [Candidatus Terasakiella magnetica]